MITIIATCGKNEVKKTFPNTVRGNQQSVKWLKGIADYRAKDPFITTLARYDRVKHELKKITRKNQKYYPLIEEEKQLIEKIKTLPAPLPVKIEIVNS